MSRLSKALDKARMDETVVNFMGGESFRINPLDTLKMITASSIFGEPSYYRAGGLGTGETRGRYQNTKGPKVRDAHYKRCRLLEGHLLFGDAWDGRTTTEIMEQAIDDALEADFAGTLEWAATLRNTFSMRLNPQVIMVRAALHPGRREFTRNHPGAFGRAEEQVMSRADDALSQLTYFLYTNHGKTHMPSLLKRSIAKRLEAMDSYEAAKYKNAEIGLKDAACITHAHSPVIDEYMKTGGVKLPPQKKTWENLRSDGMGWRQICGQISMGHMALLRNLRGVFEETEDREFCGEYLSRLKSGVTGGKQFPFRYYNAYQTLEASQCAHKPQILDALEECVDLSMENLPKFKGKTMCLSDNSGSAWGAIPSEYGSVKIAEIDNLSSVIAAALSEEGYVGKFGNILKVYPVSRRGQILRQSREISRERDSDVGGNTEGGIWEFFSQAINNREHWDQIFIYSDQQAGHGGLYGTAKQQAAYRQAGFHCSPNGLGGFKTYINVFDLILEYRKKVNPHVNVFSIQTAGYNNVCIPEYAYRTCILYGWTGRELVFAREMIDMWDSFQKEPRA